VFIFIVPSKGLEGLDEIQSLVSKIILQGKACIDRGLRESRRDRELGERMIIKEQGIQVLA
jgi:hypothetical protein